MKKKDNKIKAEENNEIITPVSLEEPINNIKEVQTAIPSLEGNTGFYTFVEKGSNKMINAINPINQTVQPLANVIFTGNNVKTNACNSCCGWLTHNNNSGIFTLTKPGIYKIHFNANVAPTVAGEITLNITNAGEK